MDERIVATRTGERRVTHRDTFCSAFALLRADLQQLAARWRVLAPRPLIAAIVEAAEAHVAIMLAHARLDRYADLDAQSRVFVHSAYLHLLAVAGLLSAADEQGWAGSLDVAFAYESAIDVLDVIGPCVTPKDLVVRQYALDELEPLG